MNPLFVSVPSSIKLISFTLALLVLAQQSQCSSSILQCGDFGTEDLIKAMTTIRQYCSMEPAGEVFIGESDNREYYADQDQLPSALKRWKGGEKRFVSDKRTGMFH